MADRSHIITNAVTALTDWATYRDQLITELTQAGYTGHEATIRSQFTPDHFHYMDELADLLSTAISPFAEIDSLFRSQTSALDMALAINTTRDLLGGAGAFDASTGWTEEAGWTIGSGVAASTVAPAAFKSVIYSLSDLVADSRYLFEFDVTAFTSGTVSPRIFGSENLDGVSSGSTGSKQTVVSSGAGPTSVALGVAESGGFTGSVDNFKLRKLA